MEAEFADGEWFGAPASSAQSKWLVMKFGGTGVSTKDNRRIIAGLVHNRHAQAILCPGTASQRQPESGSAMQRRSDLC